MSRIHWALPAFIASYGTFAIPASADSGGTNGGIAFPWAGPAAAANDPFDYPSSSFPGGKPVPAPWAFSVSGSSYNSVYNQLGDNRLLAAYTGSGWLTLSRSDVKGTNAIYQIDFQDDGTRDLGELFFVQDYAGHFVGIGVNNNVANGYYYLRTDAVPGNTGPTIYAPRNGRAWNNNWHTVQFMVTANGTYASIDGLGTASTYPGVTYVDSFNIMANWSKPAHALLVDNFTVTPTSNLAPGTGLSDMPSLYSVFGSTELLTMVADDLPRLMLLSQGSWLNSNPDRFNIVRTGVQEADSSYCDGAAQARYDASGEWCSEFARWILLQTPNVIRGDDLRTSFANVDSVPEMINLYSARGGFTPRSSITVFTAKPGDYMTQVSGSTGSHNGHSSIILGVSSDFRYVWTVEGNINTGPNTPHCVYFGFRDFFVNGVLNPAIDGIGNTDVFIHG